MSFFAPAVTASAHVNVKPDTAALATTKFIPIVKTPRDAKPTQADLVTVPFAPNVAVSGSSISPRTLNLLVIGFIPIIVTTNIPNSHGHGAGDRVIVEERVGQVASAVLSSTSVAVEEQLSTLSRAGASATSVIVNDSVSVATAGGQAFGSVVAKDVTGNVAAATARSSGIVVREKIREE